MPHLQIESHQTIPVHDLKTQKWYAWTAISAGKPSKLFINGEVEISNSGMRGFVFKKKTEEKNTEILHLELVVEQLSGLWSRVDGWCQVKYQEIVLSGYHTMVYLYTGSSLIEKFPIELYSE